MASEGVDVVTRDQAKHWVPTGAWVGKKNWKTCSCPMASELLEGLICSCTSRIRCTNNCSVRTVCVAELCICYSNENCENPHSVSDLDMLRDDDEDDS